MNRPERRPGGPGRPGKGGWRGRADAETVKQASARVIGVPGASTWAQYRSAVAAYRQVPLKWLLLGATLLLGVVGAAAYSLDANPAAAMSVTGVLLLALDIASRFPAPTATLLVIAASTVAASPLASVYASAATVGPPDFGGAVATLFATLALTGLLAHRTSRGRPWVTTLLVAVTLMFAAPWLLLWEPALGFAWAWLAMALVLFLRGGGIAWLRDQHAELRDVLARRRARGAALPDAVRELEDRQAAQVATAALLADLPAGFTVFHDRMLPGGTRLDHLLVGPTGLFLLASHKFSGRIIEDPSHGLTHPTVPVADLLHQAETAATRLRSRLGKRAVAVRPLVVLHDVVLPTNRAQVALTATGTSKETPLGVVTILAPTVLAVEVTETTEGTQTLTDRQVARLVARVDRMCPPAKNPKHGQGPAADRPVQVLMLDDDGRPKQPDTGAAQPLFVSSTSEVVPGVGEAVLVLTAQGTFSGYRVTGDPVPDETGVLFVPLADEEAPAPQHADAVLWFPLDSVQPTQPA